MAASYRADSVLVRADALRPGDIDRLNAVLDAAGMGRPLEEPAATGHRLLAVPVTGDVDPVRVRDAVLDARGRGEQLPEVHLDTVYAQHVGGPTGGGYTAYGNKIGHGVAGWLPVALTERLLPAPPWEPHGGGPVIALLDTGVRPHGWLPGSFLVDTGSGGTAGWVPHVAVRDGDPGTGDLFSHRGHATFVAGLIRQVAPHARVLSLRVMDDDGTASEYNVVGALNWLADDYLAAGGRLDVVLLAFGRPLPAPPDELGAVEELRLAIAGLAARGVRVVASAGNEATDRPTVPACFADDPDGPVVSVGAGCSATDRAWYSNRGSWVKRWRPGSDLLSIMPMRPRSDPAWADAVAYFGTGFGDALPSGTGGGAARWSGTSFAAAVHAAELAEEAAGPAGARP